MWGTTWRHISRWTLLMPLRQNVVVIRGIVYFCCLSDFMSYFSICLLSIQFLSLFPLYNFCMYNFVFVNKRCIGISLCSLYDVAEFIYECTCNVRYNTALSAWGSLLWNYRISPFTWVLLCVNDEYSLASISFTCMSVCRYEIWEIWWLLFVGLETETVVCVTLACVCAVSGFGN